MLDADYLDILPRTIVDFYEQFHIEVLKFMARRIANMNYASAAWQAQRLIASGLIYEEVISRLAELLGKTEAELRIILNEAGVKSVAFDAKIYKAAGLKPMPIHQSPQMQRVLMSGLRRTMGTLRNLTGTTAIASQQTFISAIDLAYQKIVTGTFDYGTAIRQAIYDVVSDGVQVIHFKSGYKENVDVAVRRAVLTGVNKTVGDLQLQLAEDLGVQHVAVSAHIGARNKGDVPENHEMWQGKVYSLLGDPDYPDFLEVTGYGTGPGLLGWNCRHSFYPYFKGISEDFYTPDILKEYASKTVKYNNKTISFYDAKQKQRAIERAIRYAKRQFEAIQAADLDASKERQRVRNLQAKMRDFINQTGLQREYGREQIISS